ncbi:hypothetical protein KKB18_04750, partial [bacterium]|nr:hypothetical protein [bacterium]
MKTSRLATLLTIALIVILQSSVVFADLWKMHVNPNHADQLLGNNNEIWVYSIKGGLTRWDIETGEQTRFNEGTGIPLNGIHGLVYDDEGRLLVDLHGKILRFEDGAFNLLTEFPSGDEYIGYSDGFILIGDLHNKGVHRFNGDSWEEVPGLSDYNMRFFSADPQGGFWCITTNNETNVIYYNDGVQLSFSK